MNVRKESYKKLHPPNIICLAVKITADIHANHA